MTFSDDEKEIIYVNAISKTPDEQSLSESEYTQDYSSENDVSSYYSRDENDYSPYRDSVRDSCMSELDDYAAEMSERQPQTYAKGRGFRGTI